MHACVMLTWLYIAIAIIPHAVNYASYMAHI